LADALLLELLQRRGQLALAFGARDLGVIQGRLEVGLGAGQGVALGRDLAQPGLELGLGALQAVELGAELQLGPVQLALQLGVGPIFLGDLQGSAGLGGGRGLGVAVL
jgi:hypothetical protein